MVSKVSTYCDVCYHEVDSHSQGIHIIYEQTNNHPKKYGTYVTQEIKIGHCCATCQKNIEAEFAKFLAKRIPNHLAFKYSPNYL